MDVSQAGSARLATHAGRVRASAASPGNDAFLAKIKGCLQGLHDGAVSLAKESAHASGSR